MIAPVPAKDARQALTGKGYVLSDKGNRDHEMYIFMIDGKKTRLFFKISHGAREVRRDDIRNSVRALGITGDDMYRILCCEHDAAATRRVCEQALSALTRG